MVAQDEPHGEEEGEGAAPGGEPQGAAKAATEVAVSRLFRFERLESDAQTSSTAWEDLMTPAPILVAHQPIDVLVDFSATIEMNQNNPAGVSFIGSAFQLVWNGEVLPDVGFLEIDLKSTGDVETFSAGVRVRSLVLAAAPGSHSLRVQWQSISEDGTAFAFANNATLTIEEP
jgi:hypothetical protein